MASRSILVAALLLVAGTRTVAAAGLDSGWNDFWIDELEDPSERPGGAPAMPMLPEAFAPDQAAPAGYGRMFLRGWVPLTATELTLLGVTAALPKDWTGWSSHFVRDGAHNLGQAYSSPPVWDDDDWYHNYLGHPYGGNVYYNSVRCQGATVTQSFFFTFVMSTQWEYLFEAVAERPSTQDLIVTPLVGSLLGEGVHRMTLGFQKNGTSLPEKILITVLNPMHVVLEGYD